MMASSRSSASAQASRSVVKIKTTTAIKLDESNFFSWKVHTLANLCGYELLDFIEAPVDTSDSAVVQQDQLLLGLLFSELAPSILSQVTAFTTSYDVWITLQHLFNEIQKSKTLAQT